MKGCADAALGLALFTVHQEARVSHGSVEDRKQENALASSSLADEQLRFLSKRPGGTPISIIVTGSDERGPFENAATFSRVAQFTLAMLDCAVREAWIYYVPVEYAQGGEVVPRGCS